MKIEVMNITVPDSSASSENDFKKILNSVKGKSKSEKKIRVNSIKNMSRKKDRKGKRGEQPSSIILSILFSSFTNKKKRNDNGNNPQKQKKINLEDRSYVPVNSAFFHLNEIAGGFQNAIDNKKRINRTENNVSYHNLLKTQTQYISQPCSLMNLIYCSDKKMRNYQVYFKGQRYYFSVDKHGVLNEGEDNNDSP
ncbi:hypothetical protein [Providencia rettgeri]|uniref:hypothetical protein n=1 Tax=Providencia rettgeri TaxID=587 RepID=UPI000D7E2F65|nr:hypothetical protein AM461_08080 [Providencia rettgeri]